VTFDDVMSVALLAPMIPSAIGLADCALKNLPDLLMTPTGLVRRSDQ